MSTIFYFAINRCFGSARYVSSRFNVRRPAIVISHRQFPLRYNFLQRIHTQSLGSPLLPQNALCSSHVKYLSTETPSDKPEQKKLSLYQRLKAMYKDYWYILVPVHGITSICWYGGFYYMAKSGVDIVALLETLNISDRFIEPLRNGHSTTGYLALAYALYKLSTPLRYTVTIGGTTISINYLKHWGYIKPMPSKEQLKVLYKERKETFQEKKQEMRDSFQEKKQEMRDSFQEKKQEMRDSFQEKKQELKDNVMQKFKDIDRTKKKS